MLRNDLYNDYIKSVKARDQKLRGALNTILAAIKNAEIEAKLDRNNGEVLDDKTTIKVLRSELKKRKDAIELYSKANRQDLLKEEQYQAEVIEKYLPKLMGEAELNKAIDNILANIQDKSNYGKVMGQVMAQLKDKADGAMIAKLVKSKLS